MEDLSIIIKDIRTTNVPNAVLAAAGYCNGAPFGAFAGMGGGLFGNGMGGMMGGNPWLSAGFSPGFIIGTAALLECPVFQEGLD